MERLSFRKILDQFVCTWIVRLLYDLRLDLYMNISLLYLYHSFENQTGPAGSTG